VQRKVKGLPVAVARAGLGALAEDGGVVLVDEDRHERQDGGARDDEVDDERERRAVVAVGVWVGG
jgi:hypothetical protein